MKRILSIVSIAAVFAACNPEPKVAEMSTAAPTLDTVGLAQFQQWKVQNELQQQAEIQEQPTQVSYAAVAPVAKKKTYTTARRTSSSSSRSVSNQSGAISSETANAAKAKKGISKAAKGTAIGAASGAVLGAVINKKNRVVGGVIGGVLGGGIGYGIGRGMDKKDGRY